MNVTILPTPFNGTITTPSSKSLTHRALICAALSKKKTTIINPLVCDDTIKTLFALTKLGVRFTFHKNFLKIIPPKHFSTIYNQVECGGSGSTIRFLIPIFTMLQESITFEGKQRLIERLNDDDLKSIGIDFFKTTNTLHINPSRIPSTLEVSDTNSTQLISGLIMMAPLCHDNTTIIVNSHELNPYIILTLEMINHFGIDYSTITNSNENKQIIFIRGQQKYNASFIKIEGDYSTGANLLVMGALGNKLIIKNLNKNTLQGDYEIINILKKMNAFLEIGRDAITVKPTILNPINVNIQKIPDLGPLLIGLSSVIPGKSIFSGIDKLYHKESDRVNCTIEILNSLGANIILKGDKIIVEGKTELYGGKTIDSYDDHRIIMMVIAISSCFVHPVKITNAEAISKSYPNFYNDIREIGGRIVESVIDNVQTK